MYTVYGDQRSGHCYKVQLVCALLVIDYQWVEVDLLQHQHLSDGYLAINPKHKVPTLIINEKHANQPLILTESNAIINYLAQGSHLIPTNKIAHAQMLQWQFYEQSTFQPPISAIRWIKHYQNMPAERMDEYHQKLTLAKEHFAYLNGYFAKHHFLVDDSFSLADITLFAYAHIADMGGIDFDKYPNIISWLQRIKSKPKFVTMGP